MRGLWLLALVLLAGCQHVAAPPVGADIRDLRSGEVLTAQQLLTRLAEPERLIIGEQHDNADHHAAQLWLLQSLGEQRAQGSLLLEMLSPVQQAKVDAARQSKSVPADLPAALAWQEGWDWNLYGPIVRFALSQPYPLLAANLDDSEIRAFYRNPPALNGPRSNSLSVKKPCLGKSVNPTAACCPNHRCQQCWRFSNSVIDAWPNACWRRRCLRFCWPVNGMRARMLACRCICRISTLARRRSY